MKAFTFAVLMGIKLKKVHKINLLLILALVVSCEL